jgi:glycosyltransferase 2 family protein
MRKIILIIIGLLAVAYIIFSLAELQDILAALRQSRPVFLGVAVLIEAVLLLNSTATFWVLYYLVGVRESGLYMFLMVTAGTFVNLITPSSGLGGMAVFLDQARRRGLSTGRVTMAGVLYVLFEYAALFVALASGFAVLIQRGKLNAAELTAAGFLLIFAIFIGVCLFVGYRSPRQLGRFLAWLGNLINRLINPFLHKEIVHTASAYTFSEEMSVGFSTLRTNYKQILLPFVFTLMNKLLLILVLYVAFLTIGVPVDIETVVAGFSIEHLLVYASPTPQGVGFVDSILPVVLSSMGVPIPQAVLVTLIYRAVTFWLPLVLGAMAFRYMMRSEVDRQASEV